MESSVFLRRPQKFEKISHLFWRYWVKTAVLSKQLEDLFQILWPSHNVLTFKPKKLWLKKLGDFRNPSRILLLSVSLIKIVQFSYLNVLYKAICSKNSDHNFDQNSGNYCTPLHCTFKVLYLYFWKSILFRKSSISNAIWFSNQNSDLNKRKQRKIFLQISPVGILLEKSRMASVKHCEILPLFICLVLTSEYALHLKSSHCYPSFTLICRQFWTPLDHLVGPVSHRRIPLEQNFALRPILFPEIKHNAIWFSNQNSEQRN